MTTVDLPVGDDLAALLRWYRDLEPEPGAPAFSFYRAGEREARLSRREFVAAVEHTASALALHHGIRRGDRVALLMPNGARTPMVMLAIMALGAVAVPLNPTLDADEWVFAAIDCGAVGAVVCEALRKDAQPLERTLGFVCTDAELERHAPPRAAPWGKDLAQAPAVILYTSGTTGRPKGVVLSHANLLANGRTMGRHFGLAGHAQLAVMPLYHAHALGFGLMTALASRGHLVLADRLNAFHWADIIRAEGVRVTSLVPPLIQCLLKVRVHAQQVPGLQAVLVSSAPLDPRLAHDFIEQTGIPLAQGWGLSEFTNFATCTDAGGGIAASQRHLLGHPWPSIGRPLDGVELQVRDAGGVVQPADTRGELFVRGASRMLGYFTDTGVLSSPREWIATGDEGYYVTDEAGPLFFITGRIKDLIIRDAEKISPLAVERQLLESCPELQGRLAVVGFAHSMHGEEIGAYIDGGEPDGELRARLLQRAMCMGNALRPKLVLWGWGPIPRTHTGKVQRARLKRLFVPYDTYGGPTIVERAYEVADVKDRCLT